LSMQNKNNEKNDDIIWYVNIIKKWWNRKKKFNFKNHPRGFLKKKTTTKPMNQGNQSYLVKLVNRAIDSTKFNNLVFFQNRLYHDAVIFFLILTQWWDIFFNTAIII
jgi:hypothetical protein